MVKYPESLDGKPPPQKSSGWWRYLGRHLPGVSVVLMVALLTATVLYPYVVITIPSGQVGVLWKRFNGFDMYCWCFVGRGTILDPRQLRNEGLHVVWPWDKLFVYDLRLHSTTQTYNAISKDGVSVTAQISIRFQLLHNSVGVLHKFIGPGYLASVVSPEIGSQAREVISQYTAQEVYTITRGNSGQNSRKCAKEPGCPSRPIGTARGHGTAGPQTLQRFPAKLDPNSRYTCAQHRIATPNSCRHQSPDRAILPDTGVQIPGRARSRGGKTQADRGEWRSRFPADGEPRDFGFIPALARHRGHACARAVQECKNRDHWQRQGRPADHSRQYG